MNTANYPPPVDQLLTYGDCRNSIGEWPNYVAEFGLSPEHVPHLIQMATDQELNWGDSDTLQVWAPIHAWRALGQLRATSAIEPLMRLFHQDDDNDWVTEELPTVYGMIGAAAIPGLTAYLSDVSQESWPRITAISSLEKIAKQHSEVCDECVSVLTRQLRRYTENDLELNGFLVSSLVELKAVESAKVIECAFVGDRVDPFIVGDWDDVQVELGLKSPEELPRHSNSEALSPLLSTFSTSLMTELILEEDQPKVTHYRKADPKAKAKRKMEKQARKKTRKKRK